MCGKCHILNAWEEFADYLINAAIGYIWGGEEILVHHAMS